MIEENLKQRKQLMHAKALRQELVKVKVLVAQSCLTLTPWIVAGQAPLSMEFSIQKYWSG